MGKNALRDAQYKQFKKAVVLTQERAAATKLMGEFDAFCSQWDIRYFVVSDTLLGVLEQGDFLPGKSSISIGMLQEEYNRLSDLYERADNKNSLPEPWQLSTRLEKHPSAIRVSPLVEAQEPSVVKFEGVAVFDASSLPCEVRPHIEISLFNAVPNYQGPRNRMFRKMDRLNTLYNTALAVRTRGVLSTVAQGKKLLHSLQARLIPLGWLSRAINTHAQKFEGKNAVSVARLRGKRSMTIKLIDLLPYQRKPFRGIEVLCPSSIIV
jgi:hypothetical protein